MKVEYRFDPFEITGIEVPKDRRSEALKEVASYVIEQVLTHMDNARSPVDGHGAFKALSKDYAKKKKAAGKGSRPNLEFYGDLKTAIQCTRSGGMLNLKVTGTESAKADGHCNHSGKSQLPTRRFIPLEGEDEGFKKSIVDGIEQVLKQYQEKDRKSSDLDFRIELP